MAQSNVLIINTGGTIGMIDSDGGLRPEPGLLEDTIKQSDEFLHDELPNYDLIQYDPLIDSSDVDINKFNQIAQTINDNVNKYDGFLVVHGTDTMAYSASMLSFLLLNIKKPVIFTGSQIPISKIRNDARRNLLTALMLAGNPSIKEICIFFNDHLLRGNRCTKYTTAGYGAFSSPFYPPLATVGIDIDIDDSQLLIPSKKRFKFSALEPNDIITVKIFPGISSKFVKTLLDSNPKAILFEAYGPGNISSKHDFIIYLIKQALAKDIYVAVKSQCYLGETDLGAYKASEELLNAGVLDCQDMTFESTICKLYYLLSQNLDSKKFIKLFNTNISGELSG